MSSWSKIDRSLCGSCRLTLNYYCFEIHLFVVWIYFIHYLPILLRLPYPPWRVTSTTLLSFTMVQISASKTVEATHLRMISRVTWSQPQSSCHSSFQYHLQLGWIPSKVCHYLSPLSILVHQNSVFNISHISLMVRLNPYKAFKSLWRIDYNLTVTSSGSLSLYIRNVFFLIDHYFQSGSNHAAIITSDSERYQRRDRLVRP